MKRRIYLTLERGRDIALRNLLRKVFIAGGFEEPKEPGAKPIRRTRVPVAEFAAAISLGSQEKLDTDEVECLLANMIYKVSRTLSPFHLAAIFQTGWPSYSCLWTRRLVTKRMRLPSKHVVLHPSCVCLVAVWRLDGPPKHADDDSSPWHWCNPTICEG